MSSLNRKKTVYPANGGAEAAYRHKIALFRGVSLIKRGGLPLRGRLALALLATLALYRCDFFDIFPPEIEIVSPSDNASCVGTLSCDIDATDNRSVVKVEVFLDDVSIHEFTNAPYKASLDISGQSAGTKTFKATAYDQAGNYAKAERQVHIEEWSPTLAGSYAYVADGSSGLQVIDVSNPASPTLAGSYDTPDYAFGVFVAGSYAYVADRETGLLIFDVSGLP